MTQQPNHSILGGKVQLYRRGNSSYWWCAASFGGKQRRSSTKEENLALARTVAEDWYLELRGKSRAGLLKTEKTFRQAADQFIKEYGPPVFTVGMGASGGSMQQNLISNAYPGLLDGIIPSWQFADAMTLMGPNPPDDFVHNHESVTPGRFRPPWRYALRVGETATRRLP